MMFCRKCGNRIPDDSAFCPDCGTKIVVVTPESVEIARYETGESVALSEDSAVQNQSEIEEPKRKSKGVVIAFGLLAAFVLLIIIISTSVESGRCEYYMECSNKKADGGDYCSYHTCSYSDCKRSKGYDSDYCYSHKCSHTLCGLRISDSSQYCYSHTCHTDGCYNEVARNSSNCSEHQINMRTKLTNSSFSFSLNSACGIKFTFRATNSTGKTIKYVRFKVYLKNAVGDMIQEDHTREYYAEVEIIGPVEKNDKVQMDSEIIGYCDDLSRIDINDITIVYSDGTSETGSFDYYYKK